jgi:hypothetical protein
MLHCGYLILSALWKEPTKAVLRKPLIKPILAHETTSLRLALYTFGDVHVQQVQEVPLQGNGMDALEYWNGSPCLILVVTDG